LARVPERGSAIKRRESLYAKNRQATLAGGGLIWVKGQGIQERCDDKEGGGLTREVRSSMAQTNEKKRSGGVSAAANGFEGGRWGGLGPKRWRVVSRREGPRDKTAAHATQWRFSIAGEREEEMVKSESMAT